MKLISTIRVALRKITGQEQRMLEALLIFHTADLKKACAAERQFFKVMPRNPPGLSKEMKYALQAHLEQASDHLHRMHRMLDTPNGSDKKKRCEQMCGLLEESKNLMSASLLWLCHSRMTASQDEPGEFEDSPVSIESPKQDFQPLEDVLIAKIPLKRWNY
jgi:hypothetical protein